ncbi:DUF413 domain-containing protein [Pseudoalteromonas luteoviolacea]|uniref:Macrodomain Ori protein n=1 Tax=Pseudoalteromonas luteoviolacea DSM 6061 TaxID=1365250 RepID=A0A166XTQ5_9GAMM|nr:DUF413 domain-containing protein [Pseudoalteromonas luteoviolacea]KZN40901.1 hypothetical protein N475_00575 [Pseudoalteromonas luteoviolacea DSM 6061]MBE0386382.1 hypothetical protein [Pseudoalteromonas luteoviolacea DSM 6061]
MELLHGFVKTSNFYDDINFPNGFNRSGHFTIQESELLTQVGRRLFVLEQGIDVPNNQVEQNFLQTCNHEKDSETKVERLWQKYKKLTQKRAIHTLSATAKSTNQDNYSETEDSY